MIVIKHYYQQLGFNETESISRAEKIPFFCIQKFELSKKSNVLNLYNDPQFLEGRQPLTV